MPRALFDDLMPVRGGGRAWRAVPLSLAVHALATVAIGVLVARPTLSAQPEPERGPVAWVPERPLPVTAAPTRATPARRPAPVDARLPAPAPAPVALPIAPAPLDALTSGAFDDSLSVCLSGCGNGPADSDGRGPGDLDPGGGDGHAPGNAGRPLHIGGDLRPPRKLSHLVPPYPELARRAGVGGTVVVQCVIGVDGRVSEAQVLRGHPLLDAAALEAVRQWRYEPTRLNGTAVPVVMTVSVTFVARR